jgi:hypothetical protein
MAEDPLAMSLPNFFLVGAAKAGTTSLCRYLSRHPDVFIPKYKEPHYYVSGAGICDRTIYEQLFSSNEGELAVGEGSTGYLYAVESPAWIRKENRSAKVVIILRDPVAASYSLYWHMVRVGAETLSFADALDVEDTRRSDREFHGTAADWYANYLYTDRFLYSPQISRYRSVFSFESIHIELFDDLVTDPAGVCRRLFEFLGVDPAIEVGPFTPFNVSGRVRVRAIEKVMRQQYRGRRTVSKISGRVPRDWKLRTFELVTRLNRRDWQYPPMDVRINARLRSIFREDLERTSCLIGRDLTYWTTQ